MLTKEILKKLQLEQKKLDNFIWENYRKRNNINDDNIGKTKESFIRSKIALLVEIGELANELKTFKHWKSQKDINWAKVKEELIDCLHFFLSWTNNLQIDFSDYSFSNLSQDTDYNELVLSLFSETEVFPLGISQNNTWLERVKNEKNKETFYRWLMIFEELCQKMGMNENDIEKEYMSKNRINWERQQKKY